MSTPAKTLRDSAKARLTDMTTGLYMISATCGLVDAVCFLALGGVFAEMMTGNLLLMALSIGTGSAAGQSARYIPAIMAFSLLEPEPPAGLGKRLGAVAGAVVGHDAQDADAKARKVGQSGLQESDGALLPLVGQDLDESDARGVVEADVDELPAGALIRRPRLLRGPPEAAGFLMSRWISSPGLARS